MHPLPLGLLAFAGVVLAACGPELVPVDTAWRDADLAYVDEVAGTEQIWLIKADGSDARPITAGAAKYGPQWSPDGGALAYMVVLEEGGTALRVDWGDGAVETIREFPDSGPNNLKWSGDDGRIYMQSSRSYNTGVWAETRSLTAIDVSSGESVSAPSPYPATYLSYAVEQGGSRLAVAADQDGGDEFAGLQPLILVSDFESGLRTELWLEGDFLSSPSFRPGDDRLFFTRESSAPGVSPRDIMVADPIDYQSSLFISDASSLVWSQDGSHYTFFSRDEDRYYYAEVDGPSVALPELSFSPRGFGDDSQQLWGSRWDGGVWVYSLDTGEELFLSEGRSPHWRP